MSNAFLQSVDAVKTAQATAFPDGAADGDVLDAWIAMRPQLEAMRTRLAFALGAATSVREAGTLIDTWTSAEKTLVLLVQSKLAEGPTKQRLQDELNAPQHAEFSKILAGATLAPAAPSPFAPPPLTVPPPAPSVLSSTSSPGGPQPPAAPQGDTPTFNRPKPQKQTDLPGKKATPMEPGTEGPATTVPFVLPVPGESTKSKRPAPDRTSDELNGEIVSFSDDDVDIGDEADDEA